MTLTRCGECGSPVTNESEPCIYCGSPLRDETSKPAMYKYLISAFLIAIFFFILNANSKEQQQIPWQEDAENNAMIYFQSEPDIEHNLNLSSISVFTEPDSKKKGHTHIINTYADSNKVFRAINQRNFILKIERIADEKWELKHFEFY